MTHIAMKELKKNSYLSEGNAAYLESLYEDYLSDPTQVDVAWRSYFENLKGTQDVSHQSIRDYFYELAKHPVVATPLVSETDQHRQSNVIDLINAYRLYGHLRANLDPLGLTKPQSVPALELSYYGFTDADLNDVFDTGSLAGLAQAPLKEIHEVLNKTYCHTIGFEFMHLTSYEEELEWLQQRIEELRGHETTISSEEKINTLEQLTAAEGLERYLGTQYVGQKRFSLEGGDSLIPLLHLLIHKASSESTREVVIGMAHRGRLNVLVNVLGKPPQDIFDEFEGKGTHDDHSGDVKYHKGYSADVKTEFGSAHVSLAFNPSHLEIVSPVAQGSVRARQRRHHMESKSVLPIQIHGDAAFAGQGVVMETFSLSQARGFSVGGSVHIVINNQIGFTISNPRDARSTLYCTDIAKMVQAPIFHVNADDPDAVRFVGKIALDYRTRFKKDVVIDLMCYRRHGHNEADEPMATQPIMYKIIKQLPTTRQVYAEKLIKAGLIPAEKENAMVDAYQRAMAKGERVVMIEQNAKYQYGVTWIPFLNQEWTAPAATAVPLSRLKEISKKLEKLPENFVLQAQVEKLLEARRKMSGGELPLNWGQAEILAYATLLEDGYPIRLSGQDAGRGTFAHRHAVLFDQNTGASYIPLQALDTEKASFTVVDSLLSEVAVLAFEYGFASAEPNHLVIWEAQFGDFANGAQVVIDQFISSAEQKWGRLCGLALFLPHGYEGAGPEHSSARLERFLQLCAQHNMQVCVPTTPAQTFHMIRRQMIRPFRKPLIVMTPKSLLRHPLAISHLEDLAVGAFQPVIDEVEPQLLQEIKRVILCSGKVYYDLLEKRRKENILGIAIVRVEQLYPFPEKILKAVLHQYPHASDVVWCQEEPKNQGAWYALQHHFRSCLENGQTLQYIGRSPSASPAVGHMSEHLEEQAALVAEALGL